MQATAIPGSSMRPPTKGAMLLINLPLDGSTIMFTRSLTPRVANKKAPKQSDMSCSGNTRSNRQSVCRLNETHGRFDLVTWAAIVSLQTPTCIVDCDFVGGHPVTVVMVTRFCLEQRSTPCRRTGWPEEQSQRFDLSLWSQAVKQNT